MFADHYLPGFKAGGPIRSLTNLVESLGDDFNFRIVTRDRDSGDTTPYSGVPMNTWQSIGKAQVLHLSPAQLSAPVLRRVIADGQNQVVYLNSFFSPAFTIQTLILRRARLLPRIPFVVAPRGEFSPNALRLKRAKKLAYLAFAKALGLYKDVLWQASSAYEENEIRGWFGAAASVLVVPNITVASSEPGTDRLRATKRPGQIKIVFASRISRKKNLDLALKIASRATGQITFNIYGPIDDEVYWRECQKTIIGLPTNVSVSYHGAIAHEQVVRVFSESHLFFMPTLGENYGHAIVEALLAGCPVLISDQTPWRDLESKWVGWDFSLERPDLFQRALQTCIDMDEATYSRWSESAREFGRSVTDQDLAVKMSRSLFKRALAQGAVA